MMSHTDIFMRCIEVVLRNEGGYVWHPSDPGGETNMGIAKKFYPDLDIKNLTRNQAIEIYHRDYWNKMNLTGINNDDLILHIFDMGVNAGIRRAIKMVQRIVGAYADGYIGKKTTGRINSFDGDLLMEYKRERVEYYVGLAEKKPKLRVFLNGWLNRVENTKFDV